MLVYGIHAVDALLRRNPQGIDQVLLQAGRDDKRLQALLTLARNQGVSVELGISVLNVSNKVIDVWLSCRITL